MTADLPDSERLRRELEMLAQLRGLLQGSLGPDYRLSTGVVDRVLDEYNEVRAQESDDDQAAP